MKRFSILIIWLSIFGSKSFSQNTFPSTGSAGIGTTAPNSSSILEVKSTTKGMLIPRMTKTQRDAIASPSQGLLIYQTNSTPGLYYYDGGWSSVAPKNANKTLSNLTAPTAVNADLLPAVSFSLNLGSPALLWDNVYTNTIFFSDGSSMSSAASGGGSGWSLTGNSGTDASTNFLGTTDYADLSLRTNNTTRMTVTATGNVGIGTSTPNSQLTVAGNGTGLISMGDLLGSGSYAAISLNGSTTATDYNLTSSPLDQRLVLNRPDGYAMTFAIAGATTQMNLTSSGYLGIGVTYPSNYLEVKGNGNSTIKLGNVYTTSGDYAGVTMNGSTSNSDYNILSGLADQNLYINRPVGYAMRFSEGAATANMIIIPGGNVGIGTTTPFYKLDVCGTIRAKEVRVATGWCDYVFDENYKLMPLDQLEKYLKAFRHLPDVAPASEVESEEGLKVGDMMASMIKKIEELTLYTIEQNKKITQLQDQMNHLQSK
jgi:hypothetical protein